MRRILCRGLQASAIIALLGRHRYAHLKPNGNKWTTEDSLLGKHPYVSCCHDTIDLYHEWPNQSPRAHTQRRGDILQYRLERFAVIKRAMSVELHTGGQRPQQTLKLDAAAMQL